MCVSATVSIERRDVRLRASVPIALESAGLGGPDPEVDDMKSVPKHAFAHVWGLGHNLAWTEEFGRDLMKSPATFVYREATRPATRTATAGIEATNTASAPWTSTGWRSRSRTLMGSGRSHSVSSTCRTTCPTDGVVDPWLGFCPEA